MPRRGGRERYRTKAQIKNATDYSPPRHTDLGPVITLNGKPVLQGGIALCRLHGVPWTRCNECSKAVR